MEASNNHVSNTNSALGDITNIATALEQVKIKPSEKGWTEPVPYNYDALDADTKEKADAQRAAGVQIPGWAFGATRYQWLDEFGEIGPADEALEAELFTQRQMPTQGEYWETLTDFSVHQEGPVQIKPFFNFVDAGLHPAMLENLKRCGFEGATPIQAYAIPAVLQGHDVIGTAQTGSGKSLAYLAPVFSKLMGKTKQLAAPRRKAKRFNPDMDAMTAEPLVVIIVPSRELAIQVFDEARRLAYRTMLRPCALYGGAPLREQIADLAQGCDVLIATPGRLKAVMEKPRVLSMARLKFTIIDEADQLLHPDWEDELKGILMSGASVIDGDHQFMMFSATFSKEARQLARQYLTNEYVRISVGRIGSTHENIIQQVIWCEDNLKKQALSDLLFASPPCRTMVFVNTITRCDLVDDYLFNMGFPCTSVHSERTQREREDAIMAFRSGKAPILVSTPVVARGLDVKNVMHIIQYDLPSMEHGGINEYVHRIGRTARIGNRGQASAFYNERNQDIAPSLTKLLMEAKQPVPDFLEQYKPEDGVIAWDDETDDENADGGGVTANAAESDGWGLPAAASAVKVEEESFAPPAADAGDW